MSLLKDNSIRKISSFSSIATAAIGPDSDNRISFFLKHIIVHLSKNEQLELMLVCKDWFYIILPIIYESPKFGSYWKTEWESFSKLLSNLKPKRANIFYDDDKFYTQMIRGSIKKLTLSNIAYNLYSDIDENWLSWILTELTNLEFLDLSGCEFVTNQSISAFSSNLERKRGKSKIYGQASNPGIFNVGSMWQFPLKSLNISNCFDLSTTSLKRIFSTFTNLSVVTARNLGSMNDSVLETISENLINLATLDVSNCKGITDIGITCLISKRSKIKNLRIAECLGVSNGSISQLYLLPELRVLDISQCSNITFSGFQSLNCNIQLEKMNISTSNKPNRDKTGCDNIKALISHRCPKLKHSKHILDGLIGIAQSMPNITYLTLSLNSVSLKMSVPTMMQIRLVWEQFQNLQVLEIWDINKPVYSDQFLQIAVSAPALKKVVMKVVSDVKHRNKISSTFELNTSSDSDYDSDESLDRQIEAKAKYIDKDTITRLNSLCIEMKKEVRFVFEPLDVIDY
ncbi:hypothetical protein BB559_001097 [Furculomyces boomerangus]|uniref:F-box domain-containing protein n=2 Tax=Harpellales TaxID=61421 RepID=A0A2T9Z336_9FUNG|nr:hypothetical protein BB559_007058 [Furculomyces boomerangus]PVU98992.1 hypothetical protein BB559_001097 [Furculomyces boomerangus]PVZ97782.1 hypothetical protein BB558_006249 [Smittium angustum]